MENKKGFNFIFAIIAIITGTSLYKHFDFQNLKFEKPAIDAIYLIAFVFSIVILIKDYINRPKK